MPGALTGLATTTLALTAFASAVLAVLIFPRRRVAPIARVQTAICWACALASLLLLPFDLGLGGMRVHLDVVALARGVVAFLL